MNARYLIVAFCGIAIFGSIRYATTSPMHLDEVGPAGAPFAHTRFCLRYPDECKEPGKQAGKESGKDAEKKTDAAKNVKLSPDVRNKIEAVNTQVNREIEPQRQYEPVAKEDWVINPEEGDCNDYAVTKRHVLAKEGVPSKALLLTEVALKSGEHHLVLIVRTNEGDLVLDNLEQKVRTVAEASADYRWVRMESERNPLYWSQVRVPS